MALGSVVIFIIVAFIYFIPAIIALMRLHRNTTAIFILNLLAGWSGIGWLLAIVWACMSNASTEYEVKCEYCAETIHEDALVCRFCGKDRHVEQNIEIAQADGKEIH